MYGKLLNTYSLDVQFLHADELIQYSQEDTFMKCTSCRKCKSTKDQTFVTAPVSRSRMCL